MTQKQLHSGQYINPCTCLSFGNSTNEHSSISVIRQNRSLRPMFWIPYPPVARTGRYVLNCVRLVPCTSPKIHPIPILLPSPDSLCLSSPPLSPQWQQFTQRLALGWDSHQLWTPLYDPCSTTLSLATMTNILQISPACFLVWWPNSIFIPQINTVGST